MKAISLTSLAALLFLGACSHYSDELAAMDGKISPQSTTIAMAPQDIAPAAGGPTFSAGETLNAALAREYYAMARYENDKAYDYKAAKQYTAKAKMASAGKLVVPGKVSAFDIPTSRAGDLTRARTELISALKTQNTPENQSTLAKAQASYDCWLERAEEANDDAHFAECKGNFELSMMNLIATAAGTPASTAYNIGFGAGTAIMDDKSRTTISYIANLLNTAENAGRKADIAGFVKQGDVGASLTNSRTAAVRDALVGAGVDATRLNMAVSAVVAPDNAPDVQVVLDNPQLHPNIETKTEYVPLANPVPVAPGN